MVEYKQAPDGRLILMEINGRPWDRLDCRLLVASITRGFLLNGA